MYFFMEALDMGLDYGGFGVSLRYCLFLVFGKITRVLKITLQYNIFKSYNVSSLTCLTYYRYTKIQIYTQNFKIQIFAFSSAAK